MIGMCDVFMAKAMLHTAEWVKHAWSLMDMLLKNKQKNKTASFACIF